MGRGRITRRGLLAATAAGGASLSIDRLRWLEAAAALEPAAPARWLAGDLHIHTGYSHDVWLPPDDDNTDPSEDFYTLGYDVASRFQQAADRGLDFLAITDHNDFRSATDPGFGTAGVIGLPAYEASIEGHAQMLGATRVYDDGDQSAAAANAMAAAVRADGGLFQANHPANDLDQSQPHSCDSACDACAGLHWRYGLEVRPDTVEVWNPASPPNSVAEEWWECWLDAGVPVGATGGSDSHWRSTNEIAGPGQPTTWVLAEEATLAGILAGLRQGRTSISFQPPARGGPLLLLEADPAGDGSFAAGIGDAVPAGTPMRVRVQGDAPSGALVTVRANGGDLLADKPFAGELRFQAPAEAGWVRTRMMLPAAECEAQQQAGQELIGPYCREGMLVGAITSAVYLVPGAGDERPHGRPLVPLPDLPLPAKGALPALLSVRALRRVSLARLRSHGIRIAVNGHRAGRVRVSIVARRRGREVVLASARPRLHAGRALVRLRLGRAGLHYARPGMRATIVVEALDASGVQRRTLRGLTISR